MLSDSCHSGTVTRAPIMAGSDAKTRSRMMPPAVADATYRKHQRFYDGLQRKIGKAAGAAPRVDPDTALAQLVVKPRLARIVTKFGPACILISGCQDNQTSMDGDRNGAFTRSLAGRMGRGGIPGGLPSVSRDHPEPPPGVAVSEPVYARPGGNLREAAAVRRVIRSGLLCTAGTEVPAPHRRSASSVARLLAARIW